MLNTLAGLLFFLAFVPYIWTIVTTGQGPSPITWSIWAIVDTLAWVAMRKERSAIGQLTGAVIGAWIVTALAVIFGNPTMGSIEWVSIVGASLGIILWQKTGNAITAVVCSQAATFIGAFPTFEKAYRDHSSEDPLAWSIWLVSCICALLAVKKWNLAEALQPITFTTIETTVVILVVIRPLWL